MKLLSIAVAALALAAATPSLAQDAPCTNGIVEVIRFSKLKPGKTIADFQKAVDLHMAWYRSHGFTRNRQIVAPVLTPQGPSATDVVTLHLDAPGVPKDKRDAGWDAFVAAYRDVSDIEAERAICYPK